MIDDSGFYEPPKRERSYESDGKIFIDWIPGMPRGKEYEGEPFQEDSRVLCTGYVEGIVRRNNIQSTPSNRYKKEQRVVDFELDLPGTAFDRKIATIWCRHEGLEDAFAWLEDQGHDDPRVAVMARPKDGKRYVYAIRLLDEQPQAAKQAGGKPTTASGWTALWREKEAEGKSDAVLQRIIDTATADEFVWDGKEFISLLTDNASAARDDDDLPF